nr:hypothetical protein Hi04_10k_c3883_00021 [uncultured bacterium]
MTAPRVSIGMPVFNGARHLSAAIEAIRGQTFHDFELVICDNASTDATSKIARRVAHEDARIRHVRHATNIGVVENFRFASSVGNGEYFIWAAHDDLWAPRFLETTVGLLDAGDALLAFTGFDNIDDEGRRVAQFPMRWSTVWQGSKFEQLDTFVRAEPTRTQKANFIYGLMRRRTVETCREFFRHDAYAGADIVHLCALLCRGEFVSSDDTLFHYRVRNASPRPPGSGLSYLANRMFGKTPGHSGNLATAVMKNHRQYRELRRILLRDAPLPLHERVVLAATATASEWWRLTTAFPAAISRELFA